MTRSISTEFVKLVLTIFASLLTLAPSIGSPQINDNSDFVDERRISSVDKAEAQETPLEVVQNIYQRFTSGDTQGTFDLVSEEYEMFEPGPTSTLPWAGNFSGLPGFKAFNRRLSESLTNMSIAELKFRSLGEGRVMVTGVERATSIATGRQYVSSSLWIWEVQNGLIVSMRAYHDTEAMASALRAVN